MVAPDGAYAGTASFPSARARGFAFAIHRGKSRDPWLHVWLVVEVFLLTLTTRSFPTTLPENGALPIR